MKKLKTLLMTIILLVGAFGITGCAWDTDADVASYNISKEAEQFRVKRRIVFYNSIQDVYILEMIGNCSIEADTYDNQLEVTCKTGVGAYQKHYLGLSDNVTYTVEQLDYSEVSPYKYEIIFKPKSIIPITVEVE